MIRRLFRPAAALLAGLLALGLASTPAQAHTRSESHSTWTVSGSSLRVTFTLPDLEAARLGQDRAPPDDARLSAYLAQHLSARAGRQACRLAEPPRAISAAPGYRRFEASFGCPGAADLEIGSSVLFEKVPTHVNFAQILTADGRLVEQLLTQDQPSLALDAAGHDSLESAPFLAYVGMGVMHIFTGLDHQLFLLGLILLSRRLKDLLFVITGFTIGHSITLALAVTGLLRPHAEFIDALVGLTIALVGAETLAEATGKPLPVAIGAGVLLALMAGLKLAGMGSLPTALLLGAGLFSACYLMISGRLRDAGRLRLVVTLVFGLVHGFGFAADLLEMRLPAARLAELLVGFNLGVELGQLCLVLGVTGGVYLLVRQRWTLPRPLVADLGSAFLAMMGLFWFVSRSFA